MGKEAKTNAMRMLDRKKVKRTGWMDQVNTQRYSDTKSQYKNTCSVDQE